MAAPIVVVGTGTSVGKTHVATRLLRAFEFLGHSPVGYKPVETGLPEASESSDAARLADASPFHVKPELRRFTFPLPVSAHLAARHSGAAIDLAVLRDEIRRATAAASPLVVELPGGAFSPLTDNTLAAEFLLTLEGAVLLLVAPDRLGVLHDIAATTRACSSIGLRIAGIALSASRPIDASSGTNAAEVHVVTSVPLLATLPWEDPTSAPSAEDPSVAVARYLARLALV